MTSWVEADLAEVCTLITDGTHHSPPNSACGDFKYVTAKNIRPWGLDINDITYVDAETHRGIYARCPVEYGDVLYIKDGVTTGIAALNTLKEPFSMLSSVALLKPDRMVLDSSYLKHWLNSPGAYRSMTGEMTGTAIKRLVLKQIRATRIQVAPLPEQKRIADKLDSVLARVDACRDRLDRIPALLKRFRQSILAAATSGRLTEDLRQSGAIGDAGAQIAQWLKERSNTDKKPPADPDLTHWDLEAPLGWIICSVSQFAECLDRLRVPIKRELRKNSSGLYPYYGANGEVGKIDEYIFDDELVLVTEDETFYGREKPIAYRSSGKCWVNNHAHVLRAPTKTANDYLCFALMYYKVIPWLSGTTGRAKLTQQALNTLPIACPPGTEMMEIVRRVETLFAFADRLEARYAAARKQAGQLTPALLAKAFRGELVPQDPNDEPAAELLKRVAASRAEAPKARRGRKSA
ncbi:restriction endonuclease subunit S [Azoarcus sp. KH32C]|uniref:restriction endonuclease subunit S n=1 Tax=Azoarcus sp. KH32C TaxID=748247 RepID=UPI0002386A2A|nr:restriction endonuclease subunit S [Azoarcus sp. KH32C]BAL23786.1 type I restriction/modification system, S subunit [Azoarcus sp. KH32C]